MELNMDSLFNSMVAIFAGVLPEVIGFLILGFLLVVSAAAGVQLFRESRQRRWRRRHV